MHLRDRDARKTRSASAICTVSVGRSQSRGSSLTLRRKCRSSPELKQIFRSLGNDRLDVAVGADQFERLEPGCHQRSFRQLRLSGRLRTTRATPAPSSCSRISSGHCLSVRHWSCIVILPLIAFGVVAARHEQCIECDAAAGQDDIRIDIDRLDNVGKVFGDAAERDQRVDNGFGIERRSGAIADS